MTSSSTTSASADTTVGLAISPKSAEKPASTAKKQFVPSRNLDRPVTTYEWVDDGTTVDAPPGAQVLDEGGGRNEIASCRFVKYLMPKNTYYNTRNAHTHARCCWLGMLYNI